MVIDPWGKIISELKQAPGVICAQLDFTLQNSIQKKMPISKHGHDFFRAN
jgi:predicted amidohydrolase